VKKLVFSTNFFNRFRKITLISFFNKYTFNYIISSYKSFQIKNGISKIFKKGVRIFRRRKSVTNKEEEEEREKNKWDKLHEKNSDRMLNLCINLRGFYLKSGL
jgi:hypothetical protein